METSTNSESKALWSAQVIGWVTLFFGIASGFIVASMNWFRMGYKSKAYLHVAIALFIVCVDAFFLQDYLRLSHYLSTKEYFTRVLVTLLLTFSAIAYLHTATRKDIETFQQHGKLIPSWSWLFAFLLGFVCFISFRVLDNLAFTNRLSSFQNHFYCEVLKPGMTLKEVETTLDGVGTNLFVDGEGIINTDNLKFAPNATPAYFRIVMFNTENEEIQRALSWKRLGFDSHDRLIWVNVQCP
jgi:hypothetical protein